MVWNLLEMFGKSKKDVTLYEERVSWICGWGSNIMELYLFGFIGGGEDNVLERYGCCNVAHAKRTLHIKHPKNISNAMLLGVPKRKTIICWLLVNQFLN